MSSEGATAAAGRLSSVRTSFPKIKPKTKAPPTLERPEFRGEKRIQQVEEGVKKIAVLMIEGAKARKVFISTTVILLNFNVTLASSLPSGAEPTLSAHFGVTSKLQKPLPVAIFLVGYIFGPIVVAPLSESWGRRPVFLASFAMHTVFTLASAFAPNWAAFLFFRFMLGCGAAAPQTVSGGLFCDIYPDLGPRGMAVTMLGLTSNVGPLVGPIISGFSSTTPARWQWQFWYSLVLIGLNWPMLLVMPETFAPIVAAKAAGAADTTTTAVTALASTPTATRDTAWHKARAAALNLARPIRILAEPLVFFTDLFILYQYVIFFLYFGVYPFVFRRTYGMSDGTASLMFLPVGLGAVLAIFIFMAWDRFHKVSVHRKKPWALREEYRRLPLACLGGPLFALSQFWLGWTARSDLHWAAPAMSGVALGAGIDLTFLALLNYLTDAYDIYSASALASSVFTRNILAAILLPLTTYPLYENLGTSWACTLLGCLCLLLAPIPFAFIRWGPAMRKHSPFCQELARIRGETVGHGVGDAQAPSAGCGNKTQMGVAQLSA
ncbi:Major facilitator superfamily domain, general substrate transporter [Moelleriella libera RCEF 2490]|uniref:Major facilitator superfamily domain, general substrate transporter n=1 Tax=Moelleriella libera RCEF 2490 TaxID=1081109 RepID=A0A162IV26_9HYPO|nr:Major facilitator superfamily domain, general substrate transporter [Moelleriella libera RCEF 2490]